MKKIITLILLITISFSLFANLETGSHQKIYPVDSEVFGAITSLYINSGFALPSTAGPWSQAELLRMFSKINRSSLSKGAQETYDYVEEVLRGPKKVVKFELLTALEGYYHIDTDNFITNEDWIRSYDDRKTFLGVNLETWPSKNFYGFVNVSIIPQLIQGFSDTEGPISLFMGREAFTFNLFFVPEFGNFQYIDLGMPYRALGAIGGDRWNFVVGREKLSWGPGITGNFMLGDHVKYHNMGRLTTYGNKFKYTLAASFFSHPDNYYPILELETDGKTPKNPAKYNNKQSSLTGLNMFLGHRLEWRLFKDKVGFALSEAIMYQSLDNTFDFRVLNPSMIYHNYYIRSNANSLVTIEFDYTPIKGLNIYGQIAIDEFALPGIEKVPGVDNGANPSANGYMVGIKGDYPVKEGQLYGSFEWAYTNPYLYLRDSSGAPKDNWSKYGLNWVVAIREVMAGGGSYYDETFLGYKFGPDAMTFNLNVGYKRYGKWNVESNFFYMLHGTHDKWTMWQGVDASEGGSNPVYQTGLTEQHLTNNYGDVDANLRDAISKTLVIGVKGGYTILKNFDAYAQVDYINIVNPKNIAANAPLNDVQITFGVSYLL